MIAASVSDFAYRSLDVGLVGSVELVAHLGESFLALIDHLVSGVSGVDVFLASGVLCRILFSLADRLVDVLLGEVGGSGDSDVLLLAGAEVSRGDVNDAVGVYIEGDFDLRNAAAGRSDAVEVETSERFIVGSHLALALQDVDFD